MNVSHSSGHADTALNKSMLILLWSLAFVTLICIGKIILPTEASTEALAEPYTIKTLTNVHSFNGKPYGISYIDERTKQKKMLTVWYDQDETRMRDPWEQFLSSQVNIYYDLPPGSKSYVSISPRKHTPAGIDSIRTYRYNKMEIHMPRPE